MEKFDVYGVCNPLIDLLVNIPDSFLQKNRIEKNVMHLISDKNQQKLLSSLNEEEYSIEFASGGSGANSMIGIAQLGGKTAFSGKIGGDNHGKIYRNKLEEQGVSSFLGEGNGNTGSCLVLVTDDGCRTMNTHLGISQDLSVNDIRPEIIEASKFLYLTGYLWDTESQKKSVYAALEVAKKTKTKVAFSLSDPFCVKRHKDDFKNLLQEYCSVVFCNQEEAFSISETNISQEAIDILRKWTELAVLTLGDKGAVISHFGQTYYIDPFSTRVRDTTGAGDAFAAGFLFGITNKYSTLESGRIGSALAGAVIEQMGPRYQGNAKRLIKEKIGIKL